MVEGYTANLSPWDTNVALRILEVDPTKVDLVVKVQEELKNSSGILRKGALAYSLVGRDKRVGETKIRESTITYIDHISRFEDNDPLGRKVLAFVGNGNLLMNLWFVAWVIGELFCLKSERVGDKGVPYSSLVVWKDKRVTIEDIWFRDGKVRLNTPYGKDITEELLYTTSGQRLMSRGNFVPPFEIREQYYDLRHLLLFPFFGDQEGYFGLNELGMKAEKRERALKKLPVELGFRIDEERARKALSEKGYDDCPEVKDEGQYCILGHKISMVFKPGIFPHNIIGVTDNGKVLSIQVTGRSNTAGLILSMADKLFEDIRGRFGIQVKDAILLDNGGDVMMQYDGKMVVQSFMYPPRDRLRSVILFVGTADSKDGIRLIEG